MKTAYVHSHAHDLSVDPVSDMTTKRDTLKNVPNSPVCTTTAADKLSDIRLATRQKAFNAYRSLSIHKGCLCHKAPKWAKMTTCWAEFNHLTACVMITWHESGDYSKAWDHLVALDKSGV